MLTNDKGNTDQDPFDYYAGGGDIASWGRVHLGIWNSVNHMLASEGAGEWATTPEASEWLVESEKFSDLSNVGFGLEAMADFGTDWFNSEGVIGDTITSAKEGERLLEHLRAQAGTPGGGDHASTDNPESDPPGVERDIRLALSGAAVLALAYGAWRITR